MNQDELTALEAAKDYILGFVLFIFGLFGWQMKRNATRLDALEKDSVPRTEFNNTVDSLRNTIEKTQTGLTQRIDEGNRGINERLDRLLEILPRGQ